MEGVFEKPVKVKNLVAIDTNKAMAVEDPIRVMILDILKDRGMSVIEIVEELGRRGIKKAPTTVRHHVDLLKNAGLIELTRMEGVKGGILKYYASNTKVLDYKLPDNFDEGLGDAISDAHKTVSRMINKMFAKHEREIRKAADSLKPCPYCSTQHFVEYVIVQVLNRALLETFQDKEFKGLLDGLSKRL